MQRKRILRNNAALWSMRFLTLLSSSLVLLIIAGLIVRSLPILQDESILHLIGSSAWRPLRGEFGFLPFIMGTFWVTALAVIIALPLCLLTAVFLSEYAPLRIRNLAAPLIDLIAGLPSVIFGIWGILTLVPMIKNHLAPEFGLFSSGYCVLTGGLVLAVMIFPVIIHVTLEVLGNVPAHLREVSLALGATKWQTTRKVVLRKAAPGILAAVILGLSRAFGETMAVLMVTGNVARVPSSVFDPAYPLPALIANNYGEMLSIPKYDAALMLASLILLAIVLLFNILSRVILIRIERSVR